jgi:hypothetical protein
MSRPVDPALVEALGNLLSLRHVGEDQAATWEVLHAELEHFGFSVGAVRRLQEAAEVLLDRDVPVVGLSGSGVFVAETVAEIDRAIAEAESRARKQFTKRRRLRRARMRMLGQVEVAA